MHKIGAGYAQSLHDSEQEERGGERERRFLVGVQMASAKKTAHLAGFPT